MLATLFTARVLARTAIVSLVTRRSLCATPRLSFSAAETARTKKTIENETKSTTPAKRGRPKTTTKAKKKEKKQRVRIPKDLKPPKRAPGPYFLFYSSFIKSQPKVHTLQESQEICKRAGQVWKGYSMAEKQPFYDENETRKAQAKEARDEFFRNTSITKLKELNAIRKAQGKNKYRSTNKPAVAATPFILFSNEFRNSLEGQALINDTAPEKIYSVRAVLAAAERWRSMSEREKEPYLERYKKAKEELKAEHAHS